MESEEVLTEGHGTWARGPLGAHQRPTMDLLCTHRGLATDLPQAIPVSSPGRGVLVADDGPDH